MMGEIAETAFVVGESSFSVRLDKTVEHRSALLTITQVEGAKEWQFQIPGWQPPGLGVFNDRGYIWSARALILLPIAAHGDPEVVAIDEDILRVFGTGGGWVLVCETSLRLVRDAHEAQRIEFFEVVSSATVSGGMLTVVSDVARVIRVPRSDRDELEVVSEQRATESIGSGESDR